MSYKTMLTVTEEKQDHQTIYHININASRLQEAMDGKGLYSIVTSEAMSPEEVHKLYSCRGVSETQYMQTKTQLGYGVTRVQYTQGRKPGPQKGTHHKKYDDQGNIIPRKSGVKPGTKRSEINKDGTTRKKPGVKPGTKRGLYNKDGGLRKKPGPKAKNI